MLRLVWRRRKAGPYSIVRDISQPDLSTSLRSGRDDRCWMEVKCASSESYNSCMASLPDSDPIADYSKRSRTIAVVGLSNSPLRPSHGVSAYMQTQGYRIIPVNPKIHGSLGEKSYASLLEVPEKIDHRQYFPAAGVCGRNCRSGNPAEGLLPSGCRNPWSTKKPRRRRVRRASL